MHTELCGPEIMLGDIVMIEMFIMMWNLLICTIKGAGTTIQQLQYEKKSIYLKYIHSFIYLDLECHDNPSIKKMDIWSIFSF